MSFINSLGICSYCCVLLVLLLLPHAACQISFTSKYDEKAITGLVGSSVNFTWSFSGDIEMVDWGLKKGGVNDFDNSGILVTIKPNGHVTVPAPSAYSSRVSGNGDVSSGQVIFTLRLIRKNDERYYGCRIDKTTDLYPPKFDSVYLAVEEAPQISIPSVQASYNEGSSVNISCIASGTPEPDVKWIRNGIVKRSEKKTAFLTFNSIKRADDGQYTCKANNSAGNDKHHVALVVHYKPEGTTLITSAAANTVTQGDSATFTCHVTAAEPQVSQYRFYLNGTLIKDSNDSQYTINNVQRSQHYGEYKCVPHNDVGDGPEARLTLNVNVPVQFTVLPQNVTVNETNTIVVSCAASGIPTPSISWKKYVQGTAVSKDPNTQSSDRKDAGMYVCTASNGVGQDMMAKVYVIVQYPPTIKEATTSAVKSWIGQTVTLKCVSDGVPTPTLTWYKPDGSQIKRVTATQNTVDVKMEGDQDFGGYKCDADNGLTPADFKIVKVEQIKKPGAPTVVIGQSDIQATSLIVKWTAPADDGGSPITAYRVVILKGGTEIKNENVTDPGTTSLSIGGLERDTNYTVKVFARNAVFEGPAGEKAVKTKYEGVPAAATIDDLPSEVTDDTITLKWSKPQNNGRVITQYTVYQRILTDGKPGEWIKIKTITDISVRELKVELRKGKVYEFVITATNVFGESLKEDGKIKRVKASGVPAAVEMDDTPSEVTDSTITLKWKEPQSYGREINEYTVYQRIVIDGKPGQWTKLKTITNTSDRELNVEVEQGKMYEFVVTATNVHGESLIENSNIRRVKVAGVPPTATKKSKGSSSNETILHIVYIIVIVLLLIFILVLIFTFWRMRSGAAISKTNRKNICAGCGGELVVMNPMPVHEPRQQNSSMLPSGDSTNYTDPGSGIYMPLQPSVPSWEINREQVKIIKVIGKGAFSRVAKAKVWNLSGNGEYTTVAVKMLKANAAESDRKDLLSELELIKKLKPHPHVIKLMGCVTETDPMLVLIEYVPFGDLLGYLRKSRGLNDTYFKDPDVKPQTSLTAEQLIRFAWQVADGMFYLSSKKIIHRDLAARNVLVGEGEKCKVTDFGMARNVHQDDIYTKRSRGRLPAKWTAYEALLYGTYTTQSDVWSYGVLLYEILTVGGSPYPDINAREIARKLQEGYRMPKPKHVDSKLFQIMLKCWEKNPSDRPTFAKLKDTMKDMERNHRTYVNLKQYENSLYANIEDLS
ncbi:tyrosine-protein kinase receptor Tie-1-like isoform X3 [Oculina patagonica]